MTDSDRVSSDSEPDLLAVPEKSPSSPLSEGLAESEASPTADPHEGSEDDPPALLSPHDAPPPQPPLRYQADPVDSDGSSETAVTRSPAAAVPDRHSADPPTTMDRLIAVSGPLALITFFLLGFGLGAWYIAWVVFLVPGMLRAWQRPR